MTRTLTRALANLPQSIVSVKDFGAVGDGVTDDTTAIQAALDFGKSVHFPNGTYKTTDQLSLISRDDVSITGDNATISATFNNINKWVLYLQACSNVTVSGISITANGTLLDNYPTQLGGIDVGTNGINFVGCSSCAIDGCYLTRVNKGIQINNGFRNLVTNCRIYEVGRLGISPREEDHCIVSGNIIEVVSGSSDNKKYSDGIYVYACTNTVVTANTVEDVRRIGIVLEENGAADPNTRPRNKRVIVSNNVVQNAHDALSTEVNACIWVEPTCGDETCIIQGNTCTRSDSFGIYGNSGVNVIGNVCDDCTYGIDATDGPFNVKGNVCVNNTQAGIRYRSGAPGIIDGNTVKNNAQGIRIDQSSIVYKVTVTNNVIQDNDTRGLSFDFTAAGTSPQVTSQVTNNTFISSGDEGVTTTQQPYGIWVNTNAAGISPYSYYRACNFENNSFIYTGTFTTGYPGNINVTPADLSIEGVLTSLIGFNTSGKLGPVQLGKAPIGSEPEVGLTFAGKCYSNSNDFYVSSRDASGSSDLADLYLGAHALNGSQAFVVWSRHNSWFAPVDDNARDLGGASFRWDDIYATNNVIQTSDINEKQDIVDISDAEKRVATRAKALLKRYRWKSAVAEKGDEAREHFGIVAQDLEQAFIDEGLDPGRYGVFIKSTWWTHSSIVDGQEVIKTYKYREDAPADAQEHTRQGIRYNELLAFIIAAL